MKRPELDEEQGDTPGSRKAASMNIGPVEVLIIVVVALLLFASALVPTPAKRGAQGSDQTGETPPDRQRDAQEASVESG
jgi:Sec-independent protein translocase protein TatA